MSSGDSAVHAEFLSADLTEEGVLTKAWLQNFSGEVKFHGPEKEETLIFSAEEGEVEYKEGEITRVTGKNVMFTTCPCTSNAPYLIYAEEFLLFPERWLFARGLRVDSFGYPIVWLPLYAARLGEESVPFLPEVGNSPWGLFLRWSFPWTPAEGTVGAVLLTLYPQAGRIDPALWTIWENGSLFLSRERATVRFQGRLFGEPWNVQGRYDSKGLFLSVSGRAQGWQVSAAAGLVETESTAYSRIPEVSLSRNVQIAGGDLGLRLSFGRYREAEVEGWRAGLSGTWNWSTQLLGVRVQTPLSFGLDQYPGTERAYLSINPTISFGPLSLWYQWQGSVGRSLFAFDATPSQNQIGLGLSTSAQGWTQSLSIGWDFLRQNLLSPQWTVKGPNLTVTLSFQIKPFTLSRGRFEGKVRGKGWLVQFTSGLSGQVWEDVLLRGYVEGETWSLEGGLRLGLPSFIPKRLALSAQGSLGAEWSWTAAGEYDFLSGNFVQFEAGVYRTFLGCLRVGLSVYLGGFRLSLDIPAFPEARVQFAPLDEGLRLGGL